MKKEVVIAIIFGFLLGLVITLGIRTANRSLPPQTPVTDNIVSSREQVVEKNQEVFSLDITIPEDGAVLDKEKLMITGKTKPKALIAVTFTEGEKIAEADDQGAFNVEVALSGGENHIEITASDQTGNQTSQTLNVIYSTAKIE